MFGVGVAILRVGVAGTFVNLDFEASTYSPPVFPAFSEPTALLFPGWTARAGDFVMTTGGYDNYLLAGNQTALITSDAGFLNPIQGAKSIYIAAWLSSTSIAQVGDVPGDTQSVRFIMRDMNFQHDPLLIPGPMELRMDGHLIPLVVLSQVGADITYGADATAWAGLTAELRIEIPAVYSPPLPLNPTGTALIDAIEFSPQPIPEPSTIGLIAAGLAVGVTRRHRRS
jgi:hypothetical protein